MTDFKQIKQRLIHQISGTENKNVLLAVEELLSTAGVGTEIYEISVSENELLQLSEQDIRAGRLITEEDLDIMDSEWMEEK